jgi:hypothetical protein
VTGVRSVALRLSVLTAGMFVAVFGATPAQADPCVPGTDADCTPVVVTNFPPTNLGYSIVYIDDRQFNTLLLLTALTAAVTLAQFVWRASSSLKLGAHR